MRHVVFSIFAALCVACSASNIDAAPRPPPPEHIERSAWPFKTLELREAHTSEFPGSSLAEDEYGNFYVAPTPFLVTDDIEHLTCLEGSVWVSFRDRAARELERRTAAFASAVERGRVAIYLDRKILSAPVVQQTIHGGRIQLLDEVCGLSERK